ncbi:protein kinase domain-containing protein [Lyngbya confervoides]|uniref:non-specific serine/threonine protein kinase n=1 Tax=Lyngbya confervoides BDU141951 TaxID=1574623 RepID=A0ABD4T9F7_9CYAN|nr:CD225/dispanin family protein [Lyngbya confervoides]MCM1985154.1 CD225/dispanin family protein [Lyngbya confervoides BDU141951]
MENLCINPRCPNPHQTDRQLFCQSCGSQLLLDGRYRVIQEIGGGGFGKTYEVQEARESTPKLLKVLINEQPKAIELFQREAMVLSSLNHPGIPKIMTDGYFEFFPKGVSDPLHCLVMEKIDGLNLEEYIQQSGQRPIDQKLMLRWLAEITAILKEIHHQQIFHRDIKPANIMLRTSGPLALVDFGTVRQISGTYMAKQAVGQVTGVISAGYTAPEQLNGQAVLQSDFFALGRTMVYLLTATEPSNLYDPHLDRVSWRHLVPKVDSRVVDLIDDMMARTPSQRPQSAEILLARVQDLQRAISALGSGGVSPPADAAVPPTEVQPPLGNLPSVGSTLPPRHAPPPPPSHGQYGQSGAVGPSSGSADPNSYPPGHNGSPNAYSQGPNSYPNPGPPYAAGGARPQSQSVPNYLPQAILTTLFCCLPFGIVAIIFASQVNTKLNNGDYLGAVAASNNAKLWCWISFGLGALVFVLYVIGIAASSS